MDKDPKIHALALSAATKLTNSLQESLKREGELKPGEHQDYEKTPSHIINELEGLCRFL